MLSNCSNHVGVLCYNDIGGVVKTLRSNKSGGVDNIQSDCLRHGSVMLYQHIAVLFNAMLIHGYVPTNMLASTMIPIVKNRMGDISNSDNYRAIALSSLFGKILDKIVIKSHLKI